MASRLLFVFHPAAVDKSSLLHAILAYLDAELARYASSARAAHEEATHEQSKAENKYDTRGLEASYLARGQSRQAQETMEAREEFARMVPRTFAEDESIDLGAGVEVTLLPAGETTHYFIGPRAGGTEIECEGTPVLVLTPQSPLGRLLRGRKAGESVELEARRGGKLIYRIQKVY